MARFKVGDELIYTAKQKYQEVFNGTTMVVVADHGGESVQVKLLSGKLFESYGGKYIGNIGRRSLALIYNELKYNPEQQIDDEEDL